MSMLPPMSGLDRFRAGGGIENIEIKPVLLEDAAALAEFGKAGIPGALLRDGDLERVFGERPSGCCRRAPRCRAVRTTKRRMISSPKTMTVPSAAYYYLGMTLRPAPDSSSRVVALDYEIAQEQASALGRSGRALEAALAALAEYDRGRRRAGRHAGPNWCRTRATRCGASWCSANACGLRDPRPVIRDYRVPSEVQNRMGVFGNRRRAGARYHLLNLSRTETRSAVAGKALFTLPTALLPLIQWRGGVRSCNACPSPARRARGRARLRQYRAAGSTSSPASPISSSTAPNAISEDQVDVFDDVMARLVNTIETKARAKLARPSGADPERARRTSSTCSPSMTTSKSPARC